MVKSILLSKNRWKMESRATATNFCSVSFLRKAESAVQLLCIQVAAKSEIID